MISNMNEQQREHKGTGYIQGHCQQRVQDNESREKQKRKRASRLYPCMNHIKEFIEKHNLSSSMILKENLKKG
ncbi:hypothetical protein Thermo_01368 [Thermoplasmatales archaeon]|nr:hypothetical protein Thermo_01368 [Thermoplasmatales archaeon]